MNKENIISKFFLRFSVLTFSCLLYAVSFCWFYQQNEIAIGGFTGIAQILNRLFPYLPIGTTVLVLNIPLFILAVKIQGAKTLLSSIYCMSLGSIFVDVINNAYTFAPISDKLLASVFGGLLTGISAGLQMRSGATNGGSELTARLLKYKLHHISVGKLVLIVDIAVIILYAMVSGKIYSALYGIISMYVLSISVDFVVYGGTHAKMAFIISDKGGLICKELLSINFGITIIESKGGWKNERKQMIICAFRPSRIASIKSAVAKADENAFMIVCNAHEIMGEGFGTYSPDDL